MTTTTSNTLSKTLITTLSILLITGLGAASVSAIDQASAEDVEVGQDTTTFNTTFDVTASDATEDTITLATNSLSGSYSNPSVQITSATTGGAAISTSASMSGSDITFGVTGDNSESDDIVTVEVTADVDTSGVSTTPSETLNIDAGGSGTASPTVNFVDTTPSVQSAVTGDIGNDGKVDEITVTFDQEVDTTTLSGDGSDFTLANGDVTDVTGEGSRVESITLTVNPSSSGTDVTPTVNSVNDLTIGNKGSAGGNDLTFSSGNQFTTTTDGASPVINSVSTGDSDGNGQLDEVTVTYSEGVTQSSTEASDYSVSSYSNVGIKSDDDGDETLVLGFDESGSADTGSTPDLTYSQSTGTDTQDSSGNL